MDAVVLFAQLGSVGGTVFISQKVKKALANRKYKSCSILPPPIFQVGAGFSPHNATGIFYRAFARAKARAHLIFFVGVRLFHYSPHSSGCGLQPAQ
jgi:hypothetical protein